MTLLECLVLLAVPVPFIAFAVWAIRGGLRDSARWWAWHLEHCDHDDWGQP